MLHKGQVYHLMFSHSFPTQPHFLYTRGGILTLNRFSTFKEASLALKSVFKAMVRQLLPPSRPWSDQVSPKDLVKITGYRRAESHWPVNYSPTQHARVADALSGSTRTPQMSLGLPNPIPLELVNAIFEELDLVSLFKMRQVNVQARQIVQSMRQYKIITKHSFNCYCVLLRTGWGARITLRDYFACLCEEVCTACGTSFGTFVHMPTWKRYCSSCRRQPDDHETHMISVAEATDVLKLSTESLSLIPTIHVSAEKVVWLRGMFEELVVIPRTLAVHYYTTENAGKPPSSEMMTRLFEGNGFMYPFAFCALPSYNLHTGHCCTALSCAGCELIRASSADRESTYTMQGFLNHIQNCRRAWQIWSRSSEGTMIPKLFPRRCRKGGRLHAERIGAKRHQ